MDPAVAAPYACSGLTAFSALKKIPKTSVDDWSHRKKVKKLPDFAASACDETQIIDHDHYLESATQTGTEFDWVKKEPGYWQSVLESVRAEEDRRATKAKKLAEMYDARMNKAFEENKKKWGLTD